MKTALIGGGSWATALIKILTGNGHPVNWWIRRKEMADYIMTHHQNPDYLSDVEIDLRKTTVTTDINLALKDAEQVILAVPSAFVEQVFETMEEGALNNKKVFSAIKGIIPSRLMIVGDYLHHQLKIPLNNIGVITGPCHAEEVALEKLSYLTIACQNNETAACFARMIQCRYIKATVSDDIYGTEYAAVLKNVIAIASGICHGLGYGDNFQAVLVSNALQEIKRFIDAVHPIERDISDSAYLGDLLVTCYSQFSRNRTFGNMIGKGYSVTSAQLEMNMIAEGYYAIACIHKLNEKLKVNMPVCHAVYNILYNKTQARKEMEHLAGLLN
jgi:glycerol-3-phosphate dehydrogenase (NAD(P)+)